MAFSNKLLTFFRKFHIEIVQAKEGSSLIDLRFRLCMCLEVLSMNITMKINENFNTKT